MVSICNNFNALKTNNIIGSNYVDSELDENEIDNKYMSFLKSFKNVNDILIAVKNELNINFYILRNTVLMFHPSSVKILLEFEVLRKDNKYCMRVNSPIMRNENICKIFGCDRNEEFVKTVPIENFYLFYNYIKNVIKGLYQYEGFIPFDNSIELSVQIVNSIIQCEVNKLYGKLEDDNDYYNKNLINAEINDWLSIINWEGSGNILNIKNENIKIKILDFIDQITYKIMELTSNNSNLNESIKRKIKTLNIEFNYWMIILNNL